jgi:hypothetical protein
MNKATESLLVLLLLVNGPCLTTAAQTRYWREVKGKPLVKIDWNCASTSIYPRRSLNHVVKAAAKRATIGVRPWADRAFAFDLNRDRKPEYFVPLICGATGNCTWGVFAARPAKLLGIVGGEYVYIHARFGLWPDLITYGHMSVVEGIVTTYSYRKGQYVQVGRDVPTDSRGGIFGRKVPKFLEQAHPGCQTLGY